MQPDVLDDLRHRLRNDDVLRRLLIFAAVLIVDLDFCFIVVADNDCRPPRDLGLGIAHPFQYLSIRPHSLERPLGLIRSNSVNGLLVGEVVLNDAARRCVEPL